MQNPIGKVVGRQSLGSFEDFVGNNQDPPGTRPQPPTNEQPTTSHLTDKFGRSIHDLRISITDRCNYRCVYCRTGTNGAAYAELPFADYLRMARILVGLGITKIRLTGGEPLLRSGIVEFVRDLAKMRTLDGEKPEIALTTNGHLLAEIAQPLKDAGLDRVTVSMDAVDPERFARITRVSERIRERAGGSARIAPAPDSIR